MILNFDSLIFAVWIILTDVVESQLLHAPLWSWLSDWVHIKTKVFLRLAKSAHNNVNLTKCTLFLVLHSLGSTILLHPVLQLIKLHLTLLTQLWQHLTVCAAGVKLKYGSLVRSGLKYSFFQGSTFEKTKTKRALIQCSVWVYLCVKFALAKKVQICMCSNLIMIVLLYNIV